MEARSSRALPVKLVGNLVEPDDVALRADATAKNERRAAEQVRAIPATTERVAATAGVESVARFSAQRAVRLDMIQALANLAVVVKLGHFVVSLSWY